MGEDVNFETTDDDSPIFEPRKLDEKDFNKKLNQQKLSKHELDELFLIE
ncbi:hypothetical protein HY488_01875 [Candidatus Woesearchaeota archaeon]|nr:hypothetical protein [Candidatus Woesearchaeota archaeon]